MACTDLVSSSPQKDRFGINHNLPMFNVHQILCKILVAAKNIAFAPIYSSCTRSPLGLLQNGFSSLGGYEKMNKLTGGNQVFPCFQLFFKTQME